MPMEMTVKVVCLVASTVGVSAGANASIWLCVFSFLGD